MSRYNANYTAKAFYVFGSEKHFGTMVLRYDILLQTCRHRDELQFHFLVAVRQRSISCLIPCNRILSENGTCSFHPLDDSVASLSSNEFLASMRYSLSPAPCISDFVLLAFFIIVLLGTQTHSDWARFQSSSGTIKMVSLLILSLKNLFCAFEECEDAVQAPFHSVAFPAMHLQAPRGTITLCGWLDAAKLLIKLSGPFSVYCVITVHTQAADTNASKHPLCAGTRHWIHWGLNNCTIIVCTAINEGSLQLPRNLFLL